MISRNTVVGGLLVLLCGAILAIFTDVELRVVEWVNCGPLSPADERSSSVCR
ncbi:hypothetical protein CPCC7001_1736 [Cyanobium sp. PCC 7001]|uniref:hypothetical protein n=1 Tax=Cyanobium sp. PCC 7001 TaxID=180281 RepID=UPI0001805854|nr:hypothetical protein [Cyanobium sp. PCC 7001]EDY38857.1 hypothetical protein CPCC7001_1736 [Cyanobium sp. PCC 7001]